LDKSHFTPTQKGHKKTPGCSRRCSPAKWLITSDHASHRH
jgi:hypothetical protein